MNRSAALAGVTAVTMLSALAATALPATAEVTAGSTSSSSPSSSSAARSVSVAGPLTSYDTALVPAGARARVHVVEKGVGDDGRTVVTLHVTGLLPNREYGAHAHTNACGATGAAAGPHYQYRQGPATSPEFANPDNEIWLDFTTNAAGNAHAKAVVDWAMPADRRASSVIIHVEHTHTGPHDSGVAGKRLGCLSVPF